MSLSDLRVQVWWTEADESELDLLAFDFVKTVFTHRQGCSICKINGPWCPPLNEVFDALLDWRQGRILRSKAAWLRAREEAAA